MLNKLVLIAANILHWIINFVANTLNGIVDQIRDQLLTPVVHNRSDIGMFIFVIGFFCALLTFEHALAKLYLISFVMFFVMIFLNMPRKSALVLTLSPAGKGSREEVIKLLCRVKHRETVTFLICGILILVLTALLLILNRHILTVWDGVLTCLLLGWTVYWYVITKRSERGMLEELKTQSHE